ncbi:interleukin-36 alpha-like [Dromiciops gliroides]|uniref:interleukin-36 alpha-like n=1 Tax=Dromiciops gliroides TaxID=33562 RepID=UPI001CC6FA18|nr:interleukin-36 alpha-like [Dromiciops gliroides]
MTCLATLSQAAAGAWLFLTVSSPKGQSFKSRFSSTTGIHFTMEMYDGISASPNPSNIRVGILKNSLWKNHKLQAMEHPYLGKIYDTDQQVWILQDGTLIATPNEENVNPVTLEIFPCRDESLPKGKGKPIYLGIKASGFCLCCAMNGEQPQLQLVEKNIIDLYKEPEAVKPFVFYLNSTGSTSTLESAAYSGWFISTSPDKNQPVTLTQNLGSQYNTDFFLQIENSRSYPPISA